MLRLLSNIFYFSFLKHKIFNLIMRAMVTVLKDNSVNVYFLKSLKWNLILRTKYDNWANVEKSSSIVNF